MKDLDFSDSSVESFYSKGEALFLEIKNWEDRMFKIEFNKCCFFEFQPGDSLSRMEIILPSEENIDKYLLGYFNEVPQKHSHAKYNFIDIYDRVIISVISEPPSYTAHE